MAAISRAERIAERQPSPITLARLNLPPLDVEAEAREAAERVAKQKVIRAGLDAWRLVSRAESFESRVVVGAALSIGKQHALHVSGANAPWGRNYTHAFSRWAKAHGFHNMRPATRSWAIALHENLSQITAWRDSLPERERRRLINPQSAMKRWQRSQTHDHGRHPTDLRRDAIAAWKRVVSCVQMLPADKAAQLWDEVRNATPALCETSSIAA